MCDIPDLELFPAHYQVARRVSFRAALEVGLAQSAFSVLARLHQWGWLQQPEKLAALMHRGGGLFDALGLRAWCDAGGGGGGPMSMADLMARAPEANPAAMASVAAILLLAFGMKAEIGRASCRDRV